MNKFTFFILLAVSPIFNVLAYSDASSVSVIKKRLEYCVDFLPDDGKERELNIKAIITKDKKISDSFVSIAYKDFRDGIEVNDDYEDPKKDKNVFFEKDFMECIIEREAKL